MNEALKSIVLQLAKENNLLNELNYTDIKSELDHQYNVNQVSRHQFFTDLLKHLNGYPQFKGIGIKKSPNTGDIILIAEYDFDYTNIERQNVHYTVTIQFKDFNDIVDDLTESLKNKVNRLFSGELGVFCTCPSFHYRYNYVANTKGSGIKPELRPAGFTNPLNIGIGCKHVALCMEKQVFKFIYNDVYNTLNKWYTEAKKNAMSKDNNLKKIVDKPEDGDNNKPTDINPDEETDTDNLEVDDGRDLNTKL